IKGTPWIGRECSTGVTEGQSDRRTGDGPDRLTSVCRAVREADRIRNRGEEPSATGLVQGKGTHGGADVDHLPRRSALHRVKVASARSKPKRARGVDDQRRCAPAPSEDQLGE